VDSAEISAFIDAAENRAAADPSAVEEDEDESTQRGILSDFRDAAQTYALTWSVHCALN
jgi:hypothetical protein